MNNEFPNLTPRMVFSAAALIFLITLTILFPMWLIAVAFAMVIFSTAFAVCWVMQAVVDNEWPW
jgi:hypothetical protein